MGNPGATGQQQGTGRLGPSTAATLPTPQQEISQLTTLEVAFTTWFGVLYLALLATVAVMTWRRGNKWLFFLGFILPLLWLFGSVWDGEKLDFGGMHHHPH